LINISKSNPTNHLIKILRILKDQKYTPPKEDDIANFIGNSPNFSTFNILSGTQHNDVFSPNIPNFDIKLFNETSMNSFKYEVSTTQERKRLLSLLESSFNVLANKRNAIAFVAMCLDGMQASTLKSERNFMTLFGTICTIAKEHLSKNEIAEFIKVIKRNAKKFSANLAHDYTNYLTDKGTTNDYNPVPDEFLKKVKDIESILRLSEKKVDKNWTWV
jgi:hypothetical protein